METDVGAYISHLLYEHDTVAIPGLGCFVAQYKPAYTDQVQGELHPPAKEIQFNANLVMDDGLLADYVCRQHGIPLQQAQQAVQGYAQQIREAIDRREIVVLPKLGRLYKDFEKKIQFLADGVNFNTDSYGLPIVHFYPVLRTAPTAGKTPVAAAKPQVVPTAPLFKRVMGRLLHNSLGLIIALTVVVASISIYFLFFNRGSGLSSQLPPDSRLNVSPASELPPDTANSLGDNEDDDLDADEGYNSSPVPAPGAGAREEFDSESPTVPPGQRFFVISVGVFGNQENVQRMVKRIYDAGYEPYVEEMGKLTRLGIQRAYSSEADIQKTLQDVQKKLSKDAKVIQR
jgi:nucleoid DNA-binding protein